ncbi:MAG: hypothetical protein KGI50_07050 [Patescibacteria group bacterium]|nr:hypothetical protein [Patescibacteria group bacterium]
MADYLDKSGYELDLETKEGKHLFHTLFTGGILSEAEGQMQGAIDLTFKRKIYDKILPARLLGFAFGNQMIEGKLKVSAMLPLCKEIQKFLPDQYASKLSLYEMLSVQFQTRRDDLRAPRESKSDDQAIQMIIEQEVFTPGAEFYHEFAVEDPDLLSVATLARMIELWKEKPYIGGKSSIGYGQLKLEYAQLDSAPYFDFIALNKDSVSKTLAEFEAMFK